MSFLEATNHPAQRRTPPWRTQRLTTWTCLAWSLACVAWCSSWSGVHGLRCTVHSSVLPTPVAQKTPNRWWVVSCCPSQLWWCPTCRTPSPCLRPGSSGFSLNTSRGRGSKTRPLPWNARDGLSENQEAELETVHWPIEIHGGGTPLMQKGWVDWRAPRPSPPTVTVACQGLLHTQWTPLLHF